MGWGVDVGQWTGAICSSQNKLGGAELPKGVDNCRLVISYIRDC